LPEEFREYSLNLPAILFWGVLPGEGDRDQAVFAATLPIFRVERQALGEGV
jgi:hypothetical protein